jgi:hypothetical protein
MVKPIYSDNLTEEQKNNLDPDLLAFIQELSVNYSDDDFYITSGF